MKRHLAAFGNDVVRLRLIEAEDLDTTLSWRNRDDARVWFKSSSLISLDQHLSWYERYRDKDDDFLFVVEVGNKAVGQASVYDIDWTTGQAEVGRFLVAPSESGKGYIGQACDQLVRFCIEKLGLKYLYLEVLEGNARAIRVYERHGFVEESRDNGLVRMSYGLRPNDSNN